MVLCNHTTELALRAILYLALQPPGKLSPVREVARGTGLSSPYLAKIMRRLIRNGLVRAFRGPGGGLELGQAPEAINLEMVVKASNGESYAESCVLGLGSCSAENPCPLHERWLPLQAGIQRLLQETTLASLVQALCETGQLNSGAMEALVGRAPRYASTQSNRWRSS